VSEARQIAKKVVEMRLAACVNIVPGSIESVYRWKGKVEKAREVLLLMKTSAKRLVELEKEVKRMHSYDLPEFIVLPAAVGSKKYLAWVMESVAG
jgi:periplasmic divalent cation tolerance protein